MSAVFKTVRRVFGVDFAPDHCVVPVLRFERFHRIEGPGYFHLLPGIERTLDPISIGARVGRFHFKEVMTQDNLAFAMRVAVRYTFDPREAAPHIRSRIVRAPADAIEALVEDRAEQGLRRRASTFDSDEICGQTAMSRIEQFIQHYLASELRILGISLLPNGVIIKEVKAPEKFKQTMLQVRQHQAIIESLNQYNSSDLIEQAIRAEFLNGLEGHNGNITIMSPLHALGLLDGVAPATRPEAKMQAHLRRGKPHTAGPATISKLGC